MATFVRTIDTLDEPLEKDQEKQLSDYIESTHEVIDRAEMLAIQLELKYANARSAVGITPSTLQQTPSRNFGVLEAIVPKLLPIPIPTFSGKIRDYGNFWTLFQASVNNIPTFTKLQKFNYLLQALRGEARDLIERFPFTDDNYDHALDLLHRKYGNNAQLISALQSRLENAKTEKHSTLAQRKLLETLIPLVTQLQRLGVHLDGSYNTQKVLSKFAPRIQRKVLENLVRENIEEGQWEMRKVIELLDVQLDTDERINGLMSQEENTIVNDTREKQTIRHNPHNLSYCLFCNSTRHKAAYCSKYSTIVERRKLLQGKHMCLNCRREGHFVRDCTREGCKACQGKKHHYTLSPLRIGIERAMKPPQTSNTSNTLTGLKMGTQQDTRITKPNRSTKTVEAHPVQVHTEEQELLKEIVPHEGTNCSQSALLSNMQVSPAESNNVLLLTGIARTWNAKADKWQDVEILFDTGADQSFINQDLAEQLGLRCTDNRECSMYTFGSATPMISTCGVTAMSLWDKQGDLHTVQLYTMPVLTSRGKSTHLSIHDTNFLARNNIQFSKRVDNTQSKPQILLGCDQLWDLLEVSAPRYTLPSGLQLIPSKLGYLLTGSQHISEDSQTRTPNFASITAPTNITMIQCLTNEEQDLQRRDKYWTIDSAGVYEFTGTKDAEKSEINAQVLQFFNDTLERRSDGYYVRLPYKDNHPPLPTNKTLALKRHQSSLATLQCNPKLLKDYDDTFRTQLDKGIIEEVPQEQQRGGQRVHYISHQAVITPHKQTTKLRIVFDASSHFKECPSLNDVLHHGPPILPELFAMLLRFRMSRFVVISDIEKLQDFSVTSIYSLIHKSLSLGYPPHLTIQILEFLSAIV